MKSKPSYVWAAFNARPLGMPIPPNWIGLAAVGMLGALINPGLWLIGLGVEGFYLWTVARNRRFQTAVDAAQPESVDWQRRYDALTANLDRRALEQQAALEQRTGEIVQLLTRIGANSSQVDDVRQMTWLHLKLLATRAAMTQVMAVANRDGESLEQQELHLQKRLQDSDTDDELRRSLTRQVEVIQSRRAAHSDAQKRAELVDAELERLRQQVSLVREQALLATDEAGVAQSLDALSASLNEANRWLRDQRELFAGLDGLNDDAPPADLFATRAAQSKAAKRNAIDE